MNRGSADDVVGPGLDQRPASMRPRFMNRGSTARLEHPLLKEQASMRPRFMNRGSVKRHGSDARRVHASMRPRFMNRGSTITA